ncbi:EAL domain-containing protein [Paenibacillus sp. SYP-B3998]|uniref:EAL domain-containing protein n=1 Tax=Paenibacillus sp. SYP-B3998 TaxID=2678564 RepID=A0A6G4A6A4_9BACL|nr:EAL domain-containing protein [Paenibacillus sp. SYP-B3998]NEW09474.1 EAL domain-containing protein [Paenibacillus sp. SYP-B3998]
MKKRNLHAFRIVHMSLFYVVCVGLALLSEYYDLQLIYGLTFSFTSIFLFLLLLTYGLWPGIIGALVVYTVSVFQFHEPMIDLINVLEIAFLGVILNARRNMLLLWDGVYWIVLGIPLMVITYYFYYQSLSMESTLIITTVATNGLFNALIAEMVDRYVPQGFRGIVGKSDDQGIPFGQVLFHFSITAVAMPYLIFVLMNSWNLDKAITNSTHQQAMNTMNSMKEELNKWGNRDIRGIRLVSKLQIGYLNELVSKHTTGNLFQIVITDSQNRILAGNDPHSLEKTHYDWRADSITIKLGETFYEKIPQKHSIIMPTEEWREAQYIYNDMLTRIPLQIYIIMPIQNYRIQIYEQFLAQLSYLLLFIIGSSLTSVFINRAIARNLSQLALTTTGLVDKIYYRKEMEWPNSRIVEIKSLVDNFRHTSHKLLLMYHDSLEMNKKLQEQTSMLLSSEEKLQHLAYYDVLTGLPNRLLLSKHLEELLIMENQMRLPIAVIFADLNQFKQINDTLGHAIGDNLLQTIANKYSKLTSNDCQVFRFGGDEFVFVLEGAEESELLEVTNGIFSSFAEPIELQEMKMYVSVSLGVSLYPRDGQDLNTIFKNADMAMYVAKEQGGNAVYFFNPELNKLVTEKMLLDNGIREALKHEQFQLHYQPKIDTAQQTICGLEALIRWQHPELGFIPPTKFIPLAEDSGMILEIDKWVLQEACKHNKLWQDRGLPKVPVAVNISGKHFYQGNLFEVIRRVLTETGLQAQYLIVEITEGVLIKNVDQVLETIMKIKDIGVQISIDDFGTGYSSLNQLQRMPIYQVKLDRSFISNVATDTKKSAIVKAVIELAHSMNLKVVAEGIETSEEMNYFVQLGCDELQGYYYSKPVPFETFAKLLEKRDRFVLEKGEI